MENNSTNSLCIICCVSYTQFVDQPIFQDEDGPNFQMFCEQVEKANSSTMNVGFSTDALLKTLQDKLPLISVCSECMECITLAANERTQVDLLESYVISLQLKVVKALRDLKSKTDAYCEKLNCVKERIKRTDGSSIEACCKGNENGGPRRISKAKERMNVKDAVLFRKAVLHMADDLKEYTQELNARVTLNPPTNDSAGSRSRRPRLKKVTQAEVPAILPDDMMVLENDDEPYFQVKVEYHAQVEGDFHSDAETNHDDNEGPEFEPDAANDDNFANNCSGSDRSCSPPPSVALVQGTKNLSKIFKGFNKFSTFRKSLLKRMLRSKAYYAKHKNKESEPDTSYHFKLKSQYLWEYNEKNGTVTIGGIEITINDKLKMLECSLCGHQSEPQGQTRKSEAYMDRSMWEHVAGRHLQVIRCFHCPKVFTSFKHFGEHLKAHQGEFKCEVCGRPLERRRTLLAHEWTHLSEKEKVERERREGIKRPNAGGPAGEFICSICGKYLKRQHDLDLHNETHLPDEEREKVQCPDCGKVLAKHSFRQHKRSCFSTTEVKISKAPQNIPCYICGKVFKTSAFKKRHMITVHSEMAAQRLFKCTVCQKGFKTRNCVTMHMEIHNPDNSFICSKGCGEGFRRRRHLVKHEKRCTFGDLG